MGWIAAVIAAVQPVALAGQTAHQSLVWSAYFATYDVSSRWQLVGELQERRWAESFDVHQRVWRLHVQRRLSGRANANVGFSYFLHGVSSPEAEQLPLVPELRPHVQAEVRQILGPRLSVAHRGRAEWRATSRTVAGHVTSGFDHAARLRYRVQAEIRPWPHKRTAPSLRVSDEVFAQFGDRSVADAFDQNRLQLGTYVPLSSDFGVELAYMWLFQNRVSGGAFDRDVARVLFHHRLRRVE